MKLPCLTLINDYIEGIVQTHTVRRADVLLFDQNVPELLIKPVCSHLERDHPVEALFV